MNDYDYSNRSRHWQEGFSSRLKAAPWLPLLVLFLVAACLIHNAAADSAFFVFILAICFGGMLSSRSKKSAADEPPAVPPPVPHVATDADLRRMLNVLEQMEKRLVNLEEIVTRKDFDWERRLNQSPPKEAAPASSEPRV